MHISDLLAELGRRQTGTPFALDGSGVCRIAFDDGKLVDVEPIDGSDTVHVYSFVAPLPSGDAATIYGKLLRANLFGADTGGATFALDPRTEEIVLCRTLDTAALDADRFEALIVGFMAQVRHWSSELSGPAFATPAEDDTTTARPASRPEDSLMIIRG